METKRILRVVLRMVFFVILGVMTSGSSCDKDKGGGNPAEPDPLEPDPHAAIQVWAISPTSGLSFNDTLDFGDVLVGTEVSNLFWIMNKGWGGVDLKYILWLDATAPSAAPFSLKGNYPQSCSSTTIVSASLSPSILKSGEKCVFDVVYKPNDEGNHFAKITIQSNDAGHQEEWIFVKGYGYYKDKGEPIKDAPFPDSGSGEKRSGKLR